MLYNILAGFLKLNLICGSGGMADAQDSDSCPDYGGVGSSPINRIQNTSKKEGLRCRCPFWHQFWHQTFYYQFFNLIRIIIKSFQKSIFPTSNAFTGKLSSLSKPDI